MIRFRIYRNETLNLPEIIIAGETSLDAIREYVGRVNSVQHFKGFATKLRRIAKMIGLPTWGVIYCKDRQSASWFIDQLDKNKLGEWIEYDKNGFIPELAKLKVAARVGHTSSNAERNAKIAKAHTERHKHMTEAQKQEWRNQLKRGWEKRREKIASGEIVPERRPSPMKSLSEEAKHRRAAKGVKTWKERMNDPKWREIYQQRREQRKIARQIEQGRRPAAGEEIPDWMKFPKGVDKNA
jgi:hypothetical protein